MNEYCDDIAPLRNMHEKHYPDDCTINIHKQNAFTFTVLYCLQIEIWYLQHLFVRYLNKYIHEIDFPGDCAIKLTVKLS